jgi:CDP-diacylglycerol--serine O-phosphatidyltransferase
MNLLSGFMAIVMIMENKLEFGAWLIVLAGFFDLMDGFMARLANATSNFGIELDSLSDVVSFGVAPGILLYKYALFGLAMPGILVAALPALCGAVRLARFNVEAVTANYSYFRGLPIPAQATMNVAFFLTFHDQLELFSFFENGIKSVIIPMVILLSLLMVSTVPFDKVPRFTGVKDKKQKGLILLYIGYFLTILFFQEYGLMAVFTFFIARGLTKAAINFWNEIQEEDDDDMSDEVFQAEPLRE